MATLEHRVLEQPASSNTVVHPTKGHPPRVAFFIERTLEDSVAAAVDDVREGD